MFALQALAASTTLDSAALVRNCAGLVTARQGELETFVHNQTHIDWKRALGLTGRSPSEEAAAKAAELGLTAALIALGITVPPLGAPVVIGTVIVAIGKTCKRTGKPGQKPRKKEDRLLRLAGRLPDEQLRDLETTVEKLRAEQARIEPLRKLLLGRMGERRLCVPSPRQLAG